MASKLTGSPESQPESQPESVQSHSQFESHAKTESTHSEALAHSHSHSLAHSEGHSSLLHSHTHDHHQPNELLSTSTASIISNPAVRITWIGLLVNVSMVISKGIGGVYFHSQALVADAIHSVSDMFADFLTLATVNVASKVGSPTHFPLGYGKIESVGSFMVSAVLLFAGISVGWSSLLQIFEFTLPAYIYDYVLMVQIGHSHSHGGLVDHSENVAAAHSHSHSHSPADEPIAAHREIPNINAAWLAGGSIIVKELLFRKTLQVAQATNSKVLVANAWHHRVDSLTAFVALLTVTGGVLFNVAWLDLIGGLCVSLLIIKAGWGTFKSSWYELIDRGENTESEFYTKIKSIVDEEIETFAQGDFRLKELSVLTSGANTNIFVNLESTTAKEFMLSELNGLEQKLQLSIKKDDKFVRNIYISFKKLELPETDQLKALEPEAEHEHEHEHSEKGHSHHH